MFAFTNWSHIKTVMTVLYTVPLSYVAVSDIMVLFQVGHMQKSQLLKRLRLDMPRTLRDFCVIISAPHAIFFCFVYRVIYLA